MAGPGLHALRRARIVASFLCCLFLALAGLALAGGAALQCWRAWAARGWPATEALVLSAAVSGPCDAGGHVAPRLRYAYTVGSTSYLGERIDFGANHCGATEAAEEFLRRVPVGSTLTVHYDPDDPAQASVRVDAAGLRYLALAGFAPALALAAFGVAGCWLVLPSVRRALSRA